MTRRSVFEVLSVLVCAAIIAVPVGCATSPSQPYEVHCHVPYHVAIISIPTAPEIVLRKPWSKVKGTFIGIGKGALEALNDTMEGFSNGSSGDAEVEFIAMTVVYTIAGPIYMINGGIKGAREGLPGQEIEETAAVIGQAIEDFGIQRLIRDKVAERLSASGNMLTVTPIDDVPEGGYTSLRAFGYDTVLEVSVLHTGLMSGDNANPPLFFFIDARARLINTEDNSALLDKVFTYGNGQMTFAQWARNDAHEFREELGRGIAYIAFKTVEEAFGYGMKEDSEDTMASIPVTRP